MKTIILLLVLAACSASGQTLFTIATNFPAIQETAQPTDALTLNGRAAEKRFYSQHFLTVGNYVYLAPSVAFDSQVTNAVVQTVTYSAQAWDWTIETNAMNDMDARLVNSNGVALVGIYMSNGYPHIWEHRRFKP